MDFKKFSSLKKITPVLWVIAGFSFFVGIISILQISPMSYQNFNFFCEANGGIECMKTFWQQKNYYQILSLVSIIIFVTSTILAIFSTIKPKK